MAQQLRYQRGCTCLLSRRLTRDPGRPRRHRTSQSPPRTVHSGGDDGARWSHRRRHERGRTPSRRATSSRPAREPITGIRAAKRGWAGVHRECRCPANPRSPAEEERAALSARPSPAAETHHSQGLRRRWWSLGGIRQSATRCGLVVRTRLRRPAFRFPTGVRSLGPRGGVPRPRPDPARPRSRRRRSPSSLLRLAEKPTVQKIGMVAHPRRADRPKYSRLRSG